MELFLGKKINRLSFLDGLRALAALYVLLFHARQVTFSDRAITAKGLLNMVALPVSYGHLAVSLFIVLSGYCLILPVLVSGKFDTKRFLQRRAVRILPPYYAAVLLTLGLTALSNFLNPSLQDVISWQGVVARLFLYQDVSLRILQEYNPPLWSIAVECRIYLVFPLIVAGIARLGAGKTVLLAVLCSLALLFGLAALSPQVPGWTIGWTGPAGVRPQFLGLFGFGVLAAIGSQPGKGLPLRALQLLAVLGTGLGLCLELVYKKMTGEDLPHALSDYPFGVGIASLLAYLAQARTSPLRVFLEWRPLVALGGISYSFYLLHDPILRFFSRVVLLRFPLSPVSAFLLLSLLAFLATLLCAWGFSRLIEKPTLRWVAKMRS